ncbi:MAG: hypothetical protein HC783_02620 [Rhodobacteraceae bacterium]|nr:hypothetical protein [Paracoccaceae bacterium]
MRAAILALVLGIGSSLSGHAQTLTPLDCGAREGCERAYLIAGFHRLDARPVALPGNRIALLGMDGLEEDATLWLIDPSMTDGTVAGAVEVEVDGPELSMTRAQLLDGDPVFAEISAKGVFFALFVQRTQGLTLRFFGASGKPMGVVKRPFLDPWPSPYDLEWSPVSLFARFVGMNALRFEETGLRLDYAGLSVMADYATGEVTYLGPETGKGGNMAELLDPAFDPVGQESYWFGAGLAAATNYPADGFEAQLALLQDLQTRIPYALPPKPESGDRVLDGNAAIDYVLTFAEMIMTPDDKRLAVLRREDAGTTLQVYDTGSGKLTWSSALPSDPVNDSTLVWAEDGALVHVLQSAAGTELYLYQP